MKELLKDDESRKILEDFIRQYIVDNLRLDVTKYSEVIEIDAYISGDYICTARY